MKRDSDPKPSTGTWPLTRRGFLTSIGTGAAAVAASGSLLAAAEGPNTTAPQASSKMRSVSLNINGRTHQVLVEPRWTLLFVLREKLGLTGAKEGCGRGECGACTVLMDDIPRYACMTLAVEAQGTAITTVEGLLEGETLGPVQKAFVEEDAFQCGYCTPGQIMSVEALRRGNASPTIDEIRTAVSGNLCRCGAYAHIFKAAAKAAGKSKV
jgi:xanthine dehydrogenase YagT iron-sulfur-binding subunit